VLDVYCGQVDEIIRTEVTWICWPLAADADGEPPLAAVVPLAVVPGAPAAPLGAPAVDPAAAPLVEPVALAAETSVPVTST
jgi:hypothetical protein